MSGDSFAGAAVRLAGFAGAVLGWRPGEFWAATPAELGAVVDAMRGEGDMLGGDDVERLKRMLGDCPSTGFAGPPPLTASGEERNG